MSAESRAKVGTSLPFDKILVGAHPDHPAGSSSAALSRAGKRGLQSASGSALEPCLLAVTHGQRGENGRRDLGDMDAADGLVKGVFLPSAAVVSNLITKTLPFWINEMRAADFNLCRTPLKRVHRPDDLAMTVGAAHQETKSDRRTDMR